MLARADDDWQVCTVALRGEKLLVFWKSTIGLKCRPQVIGIAVSVCIMRHVGIAELAEEVPEVFGLSAAHQLLRQVGLMKVHVPECRMSQNLLPRIKSRDGHVEDHYTALIPCIAPCKGIGHHSSDVVSEDVNMLQAKTHD